VQTNVVEISEVEDGILQITMQDRVHKNTFSPELTSGLIAAFDHIRSVARYRAVIVTGYDSYFCSGGTQETLLNIQRGKAKFTDTTLYSLPLECEIPVISAMQGHAIGGGFVFGLFADIVVLGRENVYTTNFMKYGLTPGMGATYVVPKKLGIVLAEEMLLTARTYRGAELEKRGIPLPVLPRSEVLDYARQLARDVAAKPRQSLGLLKRHLVAEIRRCLPDTIEEEVQMHESAFHLPEVERLILSEFGQ
jgi:4-carboxy-3-alkylbut-2-enoyl-[acp] decarboxylase